MSFDKGNISFRIFYLKNGLSEPSLDRFAEHAAPPLDTLGGSPVRGWVSWRHLLDRDVSPATCLFAHWYHVAVLQAEKKVPPKLLAAYCRQEEDVVMRAENLPFVNRKQKAEIKKRVFEQLQPQMPPTLLGLPVVANLHTNFVLADAMTSANMDKFSLLFRETTGEQPYVVTPNGLAILRKQVNANDLAPAVFTDDETVEPDAACDLGLEFLTWLWFRFEQDGCAFKSRIGASCSCLLEGPVTFFREGKGAHEALLRKGDPLRSPEAALAVLCGKKMRSVKLSLAIADKAWTATLDSSFAIRGLKLPKDPENQHPPFEERMTDVETFTNTLFDLFDLFLAARADKRAWAKCEKEIRGWARRRAEEDRQGTGAEEE